MPIFAPSKPTVNHYTLTMSSLPIIIAIVGPSGSGKTTAVRFASAALGIPEICSYTTRPMRDGETNGIEHYFVTESDMPLRSKMLAYTEFGGCHYWTTHAQVLHSQPNLYIVDEAGLLNLLDLRDRYRVVAIYIKPAAHVSSATVDADRKARDASRPAFNRSLYNSVLPNTSTLQHLLYRFTALVEFYITDLKP